MKLSWNEKEHFYHEVAQFTKSGIGIQEALQSIGEGGESPKSRRLSQRLLKHSATGDDLYAVFAHQKGAFTELELALLEAAEHSGRLEQVFRYLSQYFHDLKEARDEVLRRAMYPLFILHFAIFLLPLPSLLAGGSLSGANIASYLMQSVGTLMVVYIAASLLGILIMSLLRVSRYTAGADAITRRIPLMGKIRSASSYARFCMALEMQMQAGVPLLQALPVAGRASQSGLIMDRVERAVPKIDAGASLADALGDVGPLPANILRALRLGQEAGTLDEELKRWGQYYLEQAIIRIRVLSDWLPKIMYFIIVAYVAYRIITTFAGTMKMVQETIDI